MSTKIKASNIETGAVTADKIATGALSGALGYTPASQADITTAINNLKGGVGTALDTLNELATALGNDANYATTITNALAAKADTTTVNTALATKANQSTTVAKDSSTGAAQLPSGTTSERPATPVNGMIRYNSTTSQSEIYQNGVWIQFAIATTSVIDYLVVAGGGAGATVTQNSRGGSGGGGAGGMVTGTTAISPSTVYTITVGAGAARTSSPTEIPVQGGSSSIGSLITTVGGGPGGTNNLVAPGTSGDGAGWAGGSGGGSGGNVTNNSGGIATSGQGNAGGQGEVASATYGGGGGGGGKGSVGGNRSGNVAGAGGAGASSSITGSSVYYAGGGGAGGTDNSSAGVGGLGGGGGGGPNGQNGTAGTTNTGGGGGGGGCAGGYGGNGGSGIVVIAYANTYKLATATGTYSLNNSGGKYIYTFTGSGTITF